MRKTMILAALALGMQPAYSFCGFYVAKADAKLFNTTTQVIVAHNGQHSTITMSSDFKGDVKDFAMVVPVPKVLQREDIRVVERVLFDKLDAYSGPRLVEYWDQNPCYTEMLDAVRLSDVPQAASSREKNVMAKEDEEKYSVRIEAKYTVGEYDILILSAEESGGHWSSWASRSTPPAGPRVAGRTTWTGSDRADERFLQWTRDTLADLAFLRPVTERLGTSGDAARGGRGRPLLRRAQALEKDRRRCLRGAGTDYRRVGSDPGLAATFRRTARSAPPRIVVPRRRPRA